MKKSIAIIFLPAILILSFGCESQEGRLEDVMQKSNAWLWDQQADDGGWHSQTHAVLSDGKALTPYILYHLLLIPDEQFKRPPGAVEKGIEFIRREIIASMSMGKDSVPMLNYPNYSAAYALRVLCFVQRDTTLQDLIVNHLLDQQFVEHRGITPDHLAYGGWGYGEPVLPYGEYGHVDISHTRRIVEALVEAGYIEVKAEAKAKAEEAQTQNGHFSRSHDLTLSQKEAKAKAEAKEPHTQNTHLLRSYCLTVLHSVMHFLQGAQRAPEDQRLYEGCLSRKDLPYDGGFISSVVTLATNKSQPVWIDGAGYHYPSYATATCDGLLALHALGKTDTQAYKDAVHWLTENQHMNTIDGLSTDDPEQWYQVMHYYHFAVRAEAMTSAGINGNWSKELSRMLIREQTPGGYYINPIGGVNKEDDPLMATIFAVQAGRLVNQ